MLGAGTVVGSTVFETELRHGSLDLGSVVADVVERTRLLSLEHEVGREHQIDASIAAEGGPFLVSGGELVIGLL